MRPPLRLLVVGALAWTGACGADPTGAARIGTLELSGQLTRAELGVGDTASLVFRLRNTGPVPVSLTFNSGCQILPYIADSSGQKILYPSSGGWMCIMVITPLTLGPGEERTQTIRLLGVATPLITPAPVVPLEAGTYHAYALLDHPDYPLQTPLITFRVR